jgi:hypothetical protein
LPSSSMTPSSIRSSRKLSMSASKSS